MSELIEKEIIREILSYEHLKAAHSLKLINTDIPDIEIKLLYKTIGLIDKLSRINDDYSKKIIVTLSAVLWTYRKTEWNGLRDFLIIIFSRIGFSPSSFLIDPEFDNNKYSALGSLIDEFFVTINQLNDEVLIKEKIFLLTHFQKNIWQQIDKNKFLGISAPTSAGKSFIIALKAIDFLLQENGTVIYIVPTLSLVSQVSIDFRKLLNEFKLSEYEILNTYTGDYFDNRKIFVLTQEKAIAAFSQSSNPFKKVRMLVVDEIQNVERVANESDQRAKTLYDLLIEFRHSTHPDHIIISGPRIQKIGNLGLEVFGEETQEEDTNSSPVASITYAIFKKNKNYFFKQYSDILPEPLVLNIENAEQIAGIGLIRYKEDFHKFLSRFVNLLGGESINIIFSPKASQARKTALALTNSNLPIYDEKLESLIEYLSSSVHSKYDLCHTLRQGIAYHHGKLPHHVRRVLEKAISEKMIRNIVCTTTLMQGVNLPAQNVIIRNPNLFVTSRFGQPKLTNYEIANLRGRAGRLLKDLLGRTFVLDENAFEESKSEQGELFDEATMELRPGYGEIYSANEAAIENDLLNNVLFTEENKEYSFLLTYIRQTILKHGEDALIRFKSVNIKMQRSMFEKIQEQLSTLKVPIDICIKNRYWDPLDLNTLYLMRNEFQIPSSIAEKNIAKKLYDLIINLKKNYSYYFERYLSVSENFLFPVCINTEKWLKETPLKDILQNEYYNNPQIIEDTINILQNKISYGLPMFLKPIYDIKAPDNAFLRFIELGANRPVTRRLIEYSIPRETAIFLNNLYLKHLNVNSPNFDIELLQSLKENRNNFNYWIRSQLEVLL